MRQRIGDYVYTRRGSSRTSEIVELNQITLRIKSVQDVPATADLVRKTLRVPDVSRSKDPKLTLAAAKAFTADGSYIESPPRQDVAVIVPEELLEQARVTRLMFMVLMGMIAAISLVVGGIGIMNIMLATVTERTREIGIRRALGAKRRHITLQFLCETTVISLTGGLIGIMGGVGFAKVLPAIVRAFSASGETYPTSVAEWSVLGSFIVSGMIGIFFGLYPAITAARMNPIEALRHE
jgi:putative ABC transport system permease protein